MIYVYILKEILLSKRYHLLVITGGEKQKQKGTKSSISFLAWFLTEPRIMLEVSHNTLKRV